MVLMALKFADVIPRTPELAEKPYGLTVDILPAILNSQSLPFDAKAQYATGQFEPAI